MSYRALVTLTALILVGCSAARPPMQPKPVTDSTKWITHMCVVTECIPKTIAMNRCSADAPPYSPAFNACLRHEGFVESACEDPPGPECMPRQKPAQ